MAQIIVEGAPRETRGKNEARRMRVAGKVPATLYGGKGEAIVACREHQASHRDSAFGNRSQHPVPGGPGRKARTSHCQGLASGSGQRTSAARRSSAHRDGRTHEGQGTDSHFWRTSGRESGRRRLRSGYPRGGSGVLACGHPDGVQTRYQRIAAEPELACKRYPAGCQEDQAADRSGPCSFPRRDICVQKKKSPWKQP